MRHPLLLSRHSFVNVLVICTLVFLSLAVSSRWGVVQVVSADTTEEVLTCHTWSDSRENDDPSVIPQEWVNDGYCDCRSGADETETEACAGNEFWPGSSRRHAAHDDAQDDGDDSDDDLVAPYFQCPQQQKLKIAPSRLNDGVCDCCDGADEPAGDCPDACANVLAAERAERAALEAKVKEGSKKRKQAVQKFADVKAGVLEKLHKLDADVYFTNQELDRTRSIAERWKSSFLDFRLKQVYSRSIGLASRIPTKEILDDGLKGLLEPLSTTELVWFIVHACQVAGEMPSAVDGSTCVPLRLAGLDAAMVWEPKTYKFARIPMGADSQQRKQLAELLDHNIRKPNNRKWVLGDAGSSSGGSSMPSPHSHGRMNRPRDRRRLTEEEEDGGSGGGGNNGGEFDADYDDMYEPEPSDDMYSPEPISGDDIEEDEDTDVVEPPSAHRRIPPRRDHHPPAPSWRPASNKEEGAPSEKRDELLDLVKQQVFSKSRNAFLEESAKIVEQIKKVSNDGGDDEEEEEEKAGGDQPAFDPIAIAMVKNKLQKLEKQILRGFDYAISAKVLCDAVLDGVRAEEFPQLQLIQLAMGTLNHGNLTTLHVWQIMQAVIPELRSEAAGEAAAAAQTCLSPYVAASCPPRSIVRKMMDGREFPVPPPTIVQAGERFCVALLNADASKSQQCIPSSPSPSEIDPSAPIDIPSQIPDGFMGYHVPEPRTTADALFLVFKDLSLEADASSRDELDEIQSEVDKLEADRRSLQREIEDLRQSIGGDINSSTLGPDGELHALKDTCHSVDAGKYSYELCLFGSASQKERDQSGRGTDLGKWSGASVDAETGQRIWKWEHGAKCWNGPSRSATAMVTCGSDVVKVLTAEEPDTCRYVLQVESYVACDSDFRRRHGL